MNWKTLLKPMTKIFMQDQPKTIHTTGAENDTDRLRESVLQYVDTEYANPYALMIDGAWGSGKTFFIKDLLSNGDKTSKKALVYVSLYGLNSNSEIAEQVFWASISNNDKVKKYANFSITLIRKLFPIPIKDTDAGMFSINDFVDFKDCILVFDDLERLGSGLPANEAMGYINAQFVEHKGYKVIIIGSEQDIQPNVKDRFLKEKEKVVGRTLSFEPKVIEVANMYLTQVENKSTNFKLFLDSNRQFILDRIQQANITNLRTLFFFFDSLLSIVDNIEPDVAKDMSIHIIQSTLIFSDAYKSDGFKDRKSANEFPFYPHGGYLLLMARSETWASPDKDKENEERKKEREFHRRFGPYPNTMDTYYIISPIFDFIQSGFLDKKRLIESLKINLLEKESIESSSIRMIDDLYNINSDEEFESALHNVIASIYAGKYNIFFYLSAFERLQNLLERDFMTESELEEKLGNKSLCALFMENIEKTLQNAVLDIIGLKAKSLGGSFIKKYPKAAIEAENIMNKLDSISLSQRTETAFMGFSDGSLSEREVSGYTGYFLQEKYKDLALLIIHSSENDKEKFRLIIHVINEWSESEKDISKYFDPTKLLEGIKYIADTIYDHKKDSNSKISTYILDIALRTIKKQEDKIRRILEKQTEVQVQPEETTHEHSDE